MAASGSKSRKRSATSSRPLPEGLVFFVDRSLGRRYVAEALRGQGARVEIHDDHFPIDAKDPDWLVEVGRRGWVVLMKDKRVRRIRLELDALIAAKVRAFVLTAGNLTGPEMADVFVLQLHRIAALAVSRPAPFVAGVSRTKISIYRLRDGGIDTSGS